MCLIVLSYKQHPEYNLIFAANRDEFYKRPTAAAHFWKDHPHILAGKDLKAGGTWMGITKNGAFSALTNYRNFPVKKKYFSSRGHLVRDYLIENGDPQIYMEKIDEKADWYEGFNLLAGNMDKLMYYSNRQQEIHRLTPGLYGLSNDLLDIPWPKVEQAKKGLHKLVKQREVTEDRLFEILKNDVPAADEDLPDTGLSKELERAVSPVFIKTETYGTRGSTVLLIGKEGKVTFSERRFESGKMENPETSRFEFKMEV